MARPPVRDDKSWALAFGLSHVPLLDKPWYIYYVPPCSLRDTVKPV